MDTKKMPVFDGKLRGRPTKEFYDVAVRSAADSRILLAMRPDGMIIAAKGGSLFFSPTASEKELRQ